MALCCLKSTMGLNQDSPVRARAGVTAEAYLEAHRKCNFQNRLVGDVVAQDIQKPPSEGCIKEKSASSSSVITA
jgi:hypothetical protein